MKNDHISNKQKKFNSAFTLVELLIVVIFIIVLALIAIPKYVDMSKSKVIKAPIYEAPVSTQTIVPVA
ncbi:MAG: hypothetical protein M0Q46_03145 [Endomicrobiales bacterium]|nr:hypothetical protein [Endomicrobiales bacterium]